jgi:hypothetical protein
LNFNLNKRSNQFKNKSLKIETIKGCVIAIVLIMTLSSMEMLYQNSINAQVTMYKCTPDMGINVSMVNCLFNDTADTYYQSMVTEMRQNQSNEGAQDTINGTSQTATQGMEAAVNETGEALSNVTDGVVEGIKDFVNGSS